jgi:hypothetical protein
MKLFNSLFLGFALVASTSAAFAADSAGSITITSPTKDAVLPSGTGNKLESGSYCFSRRQPLPMQCGFA